MLSFIAPVNFPTDGSPVAAGDFTGHGRLDLALVTGPPGRSVRILPGNGDGTFQPELPPTAIGPDGGDVAAADLTGNGILDLVITHFNEANPDHTVSVLLGNGDGTFQAPVDYQAGDNPRGVAIGDFNGDGIPDIVVTNFGFFSHDQFQPGTTVTVLLGNGDGTFQAPRTFDAGITPEAVAVGDFTGDGRLSIVTADEGFTNVPADVAFLRGNGDGTFQEPVSLNLGVGGAARSVAVADLNGDGRLDIVTANDSDNGGSVSVLLGRGNGTFQNTLTFPVSNDPGYLPLQVAVGDFNGDGHLDLAVAGFLGSPPTGLYLLPGNGDGTFQTSIRIRTQELSPLVVGDFNGDGIDDLAVENGNNVDILLGQPGRFLNFPLTIVPGGGATSVQTADLNGNGFADLVTANAADNTVSVLLANGDGTFQPPTTYAVGQDPVSLVVADVNGDGSPDLVVLNEQDRTVSVLLGNGDGTFQPAQTITLNIDPSFIPVRLALGDFTGDGSTDLAVLQTQQPGRAAVLVLRGNGDGTFSQDPNLPDQSFNLNIFDRFLATYIFQAAALGDDGTLDLIVGAQGNAIAVLRGNGDGTFRPPQFLTFLDPPKSVTVADLNGDGIPDLVVTTQTSTFPPRLNTVYVLLGNGDGTFQAPVGYAVGGGSFAAAVGDFDGDGIPDLAVATDGNTLSILRGNGDGTFGARSSYLIPGGSDALVSGDFNGDGAPDLAIGNSFTGEVTVVLNRNDGTAPRGHAAKLAHRGAARTRLARPDATLGQAVAQARTPLPLDTTTSDAPPGQQVAPADAFFAALAGEDHAVVLPNPRQEGRITVKAVRPVAIQDAEWADPIEGHQPVAAGL